MYIRFAQYERDPHCRVAAGIFGVAYGVMRDHVANEVWWYDEICQILNWFDNHLDAPTRLSRQFGRGGLRQGVCWFRPEAGTHVAQARYLAYLLDEAERPVRELRAHRPGTEIFRDAHQIVAIPDRRRHVTLH